MKLQSQVSRVYKKVKYEKFWIVLPSNLIRRLNWNSGIKLKVDVKNNKLIVEKEIKNGQ